MHECVDEFVAGRVIETFDGLRQTSAARDSMCSSNRTNKVAAFTLAGACDKEPFDSPTVCHAGVRKVSRREVADIANGGPIGNMSRSRPVAGRRRSNRQNCCVGNIDF